MENTSLERPLTTSGRLVIPDNRVPHWDAGVRGGIPNISAAVNIQDFGATGDGNTEDTDALKAAINAAPEPGVVYLPVGSYVIRGRINLPSGIVLRGDGPEHTHILAIPDDQNGHHTFAVVGSLAQPVPLIETALQNSQEISVTDGRRFVVGQTIEIVMDNESFMGKVRSENTRGQIVKIVAISGQTLTLDVPLRLEYPLHTNPRVYPLSPKQNVGFENFHIKHISSDDDQSTIFRFWIAENCWIKNIEAEYGAKHHVNISHGRYITIQDSVFHHSYNYGGGGQGYGVLLNFFTSDSLITNNTLFMLRHSLLSAGGSSGNVISYNFSADDNSQGDRIGLADLNLHAGFSNMDLIEGNVSQWIKVGGSGTSGPYNTLFRNRAVKEPFSKPAAFYNAGLMIDNPSHFQNIIGNTLIGRLENRGFVNNGLAREYAQYLWIEKNLICHGGIIDSNLNQGVLQDNLLSCNQAAPWRLPNSLYLSEKPDFWGNLPWPAIGADIDSQRMAVGLPLHKIPAQIRYEQMFSIRTIN